MNSCYIIFSQSVDRYYARACHDDLKERIRKHNDHMYGSGYTSMANDWTLFHSIECVTYAQAVCIERHIKKMKSRAYIENLKRYPEMSNKLLLKYSKSSGLSR